MDQSLDKKSIFDKEEDFDPEFHVDQDDERLDFTIIPNRLIREQSLSPEARFLLIYLLSNKPGWKIRTSQIGHHLQGFWGRDKILKVINECIKAGYMRRDKVKKQTARGMLITYSYLVNSKPKFKISLRCPDLQGPENTVTKEVLYVKNTKEEHNSPTSLSEPDGSMLAKASEEKIESPKKSKKKATQTEDFNAEVLATGQAMIKAMKEVKPDCKEPALRALCISIDEMIRLDNRDPTKIVQVFRWALNDKIFWSSHMFNPKPAKYLREKFDQLETKMKMQPASSSKADRRARDSNGNPIKDEILDNLF
jgi:hypothetical protein